MTPEGEQQILSALTELNNKVGKLFKAFPGDDVEGHRRAHEAQIEMVEEKRKLRIAIQEKTISGLIWAALVALGTALYHEFVKRP